MQSTQEPDRSSRKLDRVIRRPSSENDTGGVRVDAHLIWSDPRQRWLLSHNLGCGLAMSGDAGTVTFGIENVAAKFEQLLPPLPALVAVHGSAETDTAGPTATPAGS